MSEGLSVAELNRRADLLTPEHWSLLRRLAADKALGIRSGTRLARVAWELQQQAFAWPSRAPWWKITKHGRAALAREVSATARSPQADADKELNQGEKQ